jgi:uncharacterized membrane protein
MHKQLTLNLFLLIKFGCLLAHEEHEKDSMPVQESIIPSADKEPTIKQFGGRPQIWAQWIGGFHFILLHFPIALIAMTAISELLLIWYRRAIFNYAARFMVIAAAILAAPTALFGLIYSYTVSYEGLLAGFLWWHMWTGIATAACAIFVALLRERYGTAKLYYTCLVFLFLLVNTTGFLGGGLTFGPYHMLPPL